MTPAQIGILLREKSKAQQQAASPKPEMGTVTDLQRFAAMRRA